MLGEPPVPRRQPNGVGAGQLHRSPSLSRTTAVPPMAAPTRVIRLHDDRHRQERQADDDNESDDPDLHLRPGHPRRDGDLPIRRCGHPGHPPRVLHQLDINGVDVTPQPTPRSIGTTKTVTSTVDAFHRLLHPERQRHTPSTMTAVSRPQPIATSFVADALVRPASRHRSRTTSGTSPSTATSFRSRSSSRAAATGHDDHDADLYLTITLGERER